MTYSYEEKYKYLLSLLQISRIDLWEKDATLQASIYYQFWKTPEEKTFDEIIEQSMNYERMRR